MSRIMEIATRHHLAVIEDACHAIGAMYQAPGSSWDGRMLGTIGDVGCFSFFANKNLVTGEGGMVVTNDPQVAQRVRLARSHGMTKSSWDKAEGRAYDYDVVQLGYNYRCTELTAALGMIQLRKLPAANERRRNLVMQYRKRLAGADHLSVPFADRLDDSAHHIFPILLKQASSRNAFREALDRLGIQTSVHYPPVHLFSQYRDNYPDQHGLSRTVDVAAREVTLPLHPLLEMFDIDCICDGVLECTLTSV
jgi:dTDP-4-amino-4,6-dideoxygalactose transaminase